MNSTKSRAASRLPLVKLGPPEEDGAKVWVLSTSFPRCAWLRKRFVPPFVGFERQPPAFHEPCQSVCGPKHQAGHGIDARLQTTCPAADTPSPSPDVTLATEITTRMRPARRNRKRSGGSAGWRSKEVPSRRRGAAVRANTTAGGPQPPRWSTRMHMEDGFTGMLCAPHYARPPGKVRGRSLRLWRLPGRERRYDGRIDREVYPWVSAGSRHRSW